MESITVLLVFIFKLLLVMLIIGIPMFIVIAFISNFIYKRINPHIEKLEKEKRKNKED
ncbi:MAG: hypothetical protein ACK4SM_04940 [Aquificaceae bacterium]